MGEITQEQVERLKAGAKARTAGPADVLGREWRSLLPDYVAEAWAASWERDGAGDLNNRVYPAALERWLATFPVTPAPDPVRDVERMADPVPTADEARSALDVAFGERKPLTGESLRKRREALGWTVQQAEDATRAYGLPSCVTAIEADPGPAKSTTGRWAYNAALTAEEKRRAGVEVPEKVATWVDCPHQGSAYRLSPPYTGLGGVCYWADKPETARGWGYRIVGGPEQAEPWLAPIGDLIDAALASKQPATLDIPSAMADSRAASLSRASLRPLCQASPGRWPYMRTLRRRTHTTCRGGSGRVLASCRSRGDIGA